MRVATRWNRCASSVVIPRWRSWTWACVHARSETRSKVAGSRYLSARAIACSRVSAAIRASWTRAVAPGWRRRRRRMLKIGSRTVPTVFDSGRRSSIALGCRIVRPRPRKRARSVSYCSRPTSSPCTVITCAAQTGFSRSRGRRVASRASTEGTNWVWTKRFENAGWAASAAAGARTISAYEVMSISRARRPKFVSEICRISASSSGETTTRRLVAMVPSRRWISTRSSE